MSTMPQESPFARPPAGISARGASDAPGNGGSGSSNPAAGANGGGAASGGPSTPRILVADDERSMRELLAIVLRREGYEVVLAENGRQAIAELEHRPIDLLISDIQMPDMNGVEVLRAAKQINQDLAGIMVTAFASAETAIEALRMGAYDYIHKPFNVDELKIVVRNALERRQLRQENVLLKRALQETHQFSNIIGRSEAMLSVFQLIETIAQTNSTVLITGESGTGKELAARAIHFNSLRRERPFVALNCGALTETLLESELFGHVRGAFTGAASNKKGLVEVADKGTIFLDEIGEMSPLMQVKLLRVLQERTFRRVGGTEEVAADIRIIAATNRDLAVMVADGRFREDLFYRINVIPVHLPALRERIEDIPLLAQHFVQRFSTRDGQGRAGAVGGSAAVPADVSLAGQHPRAGECDRAGRRAGAHAADPPGQPARRGAHAADAGRPGRGRVVRRIVPRFRLRPRALRPDDRAAVHHRSAAPDRRRQGEGGGTARHDLPVVPLLREEIRPLMCRA